jgi:uncharacterized protein YggU (UPF0235/DUF167 family)
MVEMRIAVRAKPGSSRTRVGGAYGPDRQLIVAVTAQAVDGKANDAVIRAVAEALDVPRRTIDVAIGHTARSKVLTVTVSSSDAARLDDAVERLRSEQTR